MKEKWVSCIHIPKYYKYCLWFSRNIPDMNFWYPANCFRDVLYIQTLRQICKIVILKYYHCLSWYLRQPPIGEEKLAYFKRMVTYSPYVYFTFVEHLLTSHLWSYRDESYLFSGAMCWWLKTFNNYSQINTEVGWFPKLWLQFVLYIFRPIFTNITLTGRIPPFQCFTCNSLHCSLMLTAHDSPTRSCWQRIYDILKQGHAY